MSKALGAKLIWRLATGKKEWWKEIIKKKYIRRPKSKMLDSAWTGKGTSLWQLCKDSFNIIQSDCYWIPGNGKKINAWNCSILGLPPHSSLPGLSSLADWDRSRGFHTLYDLSKWDSLGCWIGWKYLHPPTHLEESMTLFLSSLHGLSPSRESARDRIGWGKTRQYTIK